MKTPFNVSMTPALSKLALAQGIAGISHHGHAFSSLQQIPSSSWGSEVVSECLVVVWLQDLAVGTLLITDSIVAQESPGIVHAIFTPGIPGTKWMPMFIGVERCQWPRPVQQLVVTLQHESQGGGRQEALALLGDRQDVRRRFISW